MASRWHARYSLTRGVKTGKPSMIEEEIRGAFGRVRMWSRKGVRAPNKPLLLLLALGRVQRGEPRLVAFRDIEALLYRLLVEFGPTRKHPNPGYPYDRLQHDGLWEVASYRELRSRASNSDAPITELRKTSGGFPGNLDDALRRNPALLRELAQSILDAHFPRSIHEDIASAVGIELLGGGANPEERIRDRAFRELVLRAYGYQCAICGLDARLDGVAVGLEAAHVHWHANRGPDVVENGLCLCPLHHKALDLGLIGLGDNQRLLVSGRLHGSEAVEQLVGRYHGCKLNGPFHGHQRVAEQYAAWHRRQVFKGPSRLAL